MYVTAFGFLFEVNEEENTAILFESFHQQNIETIRIPQIIEPHYKVIGIADNVFKQNADTKIIEIPSTIQFIGKNAFAYCSSLSTITFKTSSDSTLSCNNSNKQLHSIDDYSFFHCNELMSILNIPSGIHRIGRCAFSDCSNLHFVSFASSSCVEIDEKAFCHCRNLDFIRGDMANLKSIGNYAFYDCQNLKSFIENSDNVHSEIFRSIGHHCFTHCWNLSTINPLLGRTKSIGPFAFSDCRNISSIEFPEIPLISDIPPSSFSHCTSLREVIRVPSKIGSFAFADCHLLSSITPVNGKGFNEIDEMAFYNCVNLENTPQKNNK